MKERKTTKNTIEASKKEYKSNSDFLMREVAGEYILVPISKTAFSGNSMMMLNETSSFIWNNLQEFSTLDSLIDRAKREFEDPDNVLEQQIYAFITSMVELGLIEERGL